ncbi:MAG: N-acetylmuramoyl-L-alanine amidase, partial [Kiritimatiellae bacterium]|nr:N-acetylmuramoyl-L-alanine amidase [Kiritimatiellia bacterium]
PAIERCYVLGWTTPGVTNVVVQGANVKVHPSGGWVTMVDLKAGANKIVAGDASIEVTVARPPAKSAAAETNAPPAAAKQRRYAKLPYAADRPKPPPKGKRPSEIVVVVDPGHGGDDTGALTPRGFMEKDANLSLAKAVRDELARRGYVVVMTREDDSFPALYDRPRVAHRHKADAFISIHHNAPPLDRDPRKLRYHTVYAWNDIGSCLAGAINRRMAEALGPKLKSNGVMHANFAVTRNPEIPSCLVETDFLTTPEGEIDCWDDARRAKVASAIAAGFADWATAAGALPAERKEKEEGR